MIAYQDSYDALTPEKDSQKFGNAVFGSLLYVSVNQIHQISQQPIDSVGYFKWEGDTEKKLQKVEFAY